MIEGSNHNLICHVKRFGTVEAFIVIVISLHGSRSVSIMFAGSTNIKASGAATALLKAIGNKITKQRKTKVI